MEKIILDASVSIKWFTKEEQSEKALAYLDLLKERKISLCVPELFFYEIGNALLFKKMPLRQLREIAKHLERLHLRRIAIEFDAFHKIFQNAQELGITFYDAVYVTLMQKEDCKFVTADRKLYEKLRHKFSFITLL